jgi:hypothetical protein
VCISWLIKCLISLMHGVTMKISFASYYNLHSFRIKVVVGVETQNKYHCNESSECEFNRDVILLRRARSVNANVD